MTFENKETIQLNWLGDVLQRHAKPGALITAAPPVLSPLRGHNRNGRNLWALMGDYEYIYDHTCELICVPVGFVTDLASIPALLRVRFNPADFAEAALVHDWLYAIGEAGVRKKSDQVFRQLLMDTGNGRKATTLYKGVRLGGESGYGLLEDYSFWDSARNLVLEGDTDLHPDWSLI